MDNVFIILESSENGIKCKDGSILYPELPKRISLDEIKPNVVSGVGEVQDKLLNSNDLLSAIRKIGRRLRPDQRIELNLRVILYKKPSLYKAPKAVKFIF